MMEIVRRLAEEGYQIDPEALDLIKTYPGSRDDLVRRLLQSIDPAAAVVLPSEVSLLISCVRADGVAARSADPRTSHPGSPGSVRTAPSTRAPEAPMKVRVEAPVDLEACRAGLETEVGARIQAKVDAKSDITGNSTCVGDYEDFVRYFRDRYAKIRDILSRRLNARPIESLGKTTAGREVSLIGMVMDVRTTTKGHRVIDIEDPTGMVTAIIQKDSDLFEQSGLVVPDEVLGVTGVSDGGGRIFLKSLLWPDMPNQCRPLGESDGVALLISDLHYGSKYFMKDAWERFLSWINGEVDDPSGMASKVQYIVIAGDLVDGIGIYPGQEGDLEIKDIYEQYQAAAEGLNAIRHDLSVVISPGNHDMVRQAEPQPALPEVVTRYFKGNRLFVGNPSWIDLGGASVLVYHGRSIDDLVLRVPGLSYAEPEKAMIEMLRRRHLCPIYGNRVSIAPEEEDHYVIQKPPSILHCGHVHTVGVTRYKGVAVINSGTWQSQTDFQKKMNIQPTPAVVPMVDLSTMKVRKLLFN